MYKLRVQWRICTLKRALHVNEWSSPTDVKHADVQLHLRKFLLSQNMFLSIGVVSHKPIVHHPNVYRLVDNNVRDDWSLWLDTLHNACIPLIVVTLEILLWRISTNINSHDVCACRFLTWSHTYLTNIKAKRTRCQLVLLCDNPTMRIHNLLKCYS